jgi:hypothetical protein
MPCRESFRIFFEDHGNFLHIVIISSLVFPASKRLGWKTSGYACVSGHQACPLHMPSVACALDGPNIEKRHTSHA